MTFEEVFKAYYPYVIQQVMRTVKNREVAEDLAQEVFIQLYKSEWQEIDYLKSWLIKSATYVAYNYIRSEKRHEARLEKASNFVERIDGHPIEERWVRQEEIDKVRETMNGMKEQDKNLLLLRYSGLKYKEIADVLKVDTSAVGMMLVRAQKKFKKLYARTWR